MFTVYIFCKSALLIPDKVIEDHILDVVFFDNDPVFSRPQESSEGHKIFRTLQVNYAPDRSPITIACHEVNEAGKAKQKLDEMLFVLNLGSRYPEKQAVVREWIKASTFIFTVEFKREEFDGDDDDAWEMLDSVETVIARECEGIVLAETTFYNSKLKKIYKL